MSEIELDPDTKQESVGRIQQYMLDELQLEIGGFDAQFLLDYFGEQMGCYYYNQGLADALKAFENKVEEFSDVIFQLEQETNPSGKR